MKKTFTIGETARYSKTITSADIEIFAAISGDHNKLHLDDQYAQRSRFKRRIAHGMLTASLISTVVGMHLPGDGAIYLGQQVRFLKPVFIDDTITAIATVIEYNEEKNQLVLKTECFNQHDDRVVDGEARVRYEPVD